MTPKNSIMCLLTAALLGCSYPPVVQGPSGMPEISTQKATEKVAPQPPSPAPAPAPSTKDTPRPVNMLDCLNIHSEELRAKMNLKLDCMLEARRK